MAIGTAVANILTMSAWTGSLTTLAVMAFAIRERKPVFAPIHAISHILFGEGVLAERSPNPKLLVSGLLLNLSAMIGWSAIAEMGFHVLKSSPGSFAPSALMAIAITVLAYIIDFHVVPKRFTPGFEHVISSRALRGVYYFLALGFLMGALERI